MTWAWKQKTETPGEKLVLLKLADCSNDQGVSYPGVMTIARDCNLSKTGVLGMLASLERQGKLSRQRRYAEFGRRTSNLYLLKLSQRSGPDGGQQPDQSSQHSGPSLGQQSDSLSQQSEPEPSGEPSVNTIAPDGAKGGANPNQENPPGEKTGVIHEQPQAAETMAALEEFNQKVLRERAQTLKKIESGRGRDHVWEAVLAACGIGQDKPTESARKAWNRAVKEIKQALENSGIEKPEDMRAEVARRADAYTKKWPNMTLTPTALARHWNEVVAMKKQAGRTVQV